MKRLLVIAGILLLVSCKKSDNKTEDVIIATPALQFQKLDGVQLASGQLNRLASFPSKYVKARNVDVWLPDHYSNDKKFAVLYMHDGQMLFDANTTWNKQEWKVDEWAGKLMKEKKTKDFIVVAIHNISEIRHSDYFPNKPFQSIKAKDSIFEASNRGEYKLFNTPINSDNYLKFIVEEVKPVIDANFSVLTDRENTFAAGSSMGGLISMYALSEYPEVFIGAACLSTHWPGVMHNDNNPIPQSFFTYLAQHAPKAGTHKFYFDFGTETLDALYVEFEDDVNTIFNGLGYDESNFKNLKFEGTDHSENAWNQRLDIPLTFLLGIEN